MEAVLRTPDPLRPAKQLLFANTQQFLEVYIYYNGHAPKFHVFLFLSCSSVIFPAPGLFLFYRQL